MNQSKHFVLWVAAVVTSLVVGGGLAAWSVSNRFHGQLGDLDFLQKRVTQVKKEQEGEKPASSLRTKPVRCAPAVREKLASTRFFSGRLVEIQKAVIASEISGPVLSMPVEVGMAVEKNRTVLAEIDTIWTTLATEQAEKRLDVTRVRLDFEKSEMGRFSRLKEMGRGMVAESDLESQELKVSELEANIQLEDVLLNEAKKRLERSTIHAPFDGTVVRKLAEVGSYVTPGSPVVEIVSSGRIDAELAIGESFIDRLSVGDTVRVWIDPLNVEIEGKIFSIVPYGPTAARSFPVRIRMDDVGGRLKVGMSVRGRIPITDATDSIVVPKDALLDRPDGALVWVVLDATDPEGNSTNDGKKIVQPVPVAIAAQTEDRYAVVPLSEEGRAILSPGTPCVIEGGERLAVGETVRLVGIDPALLTDLPKASGHVLIPPIENNPFFALEKPTPLAPPVESKGDR